MYTFTLPFGDWSNDGHSRCDKFTITCSHSADDCRKAYLESCKLTGYQFHRVEPHQFPYDQNGESLKGISLLDCEDSVIPGKAIKRFQDCGLNIQPLLEDWITDKEDDNAVGDISPSPEELLKIFMGFIGLSISGEFTWSKKPDNYLFGFWHKDLNIMVGYGIYYD